MTDPFVDELLAYRLPFHLVLDGARVVNLGGADIAERLTTHGLVGRPLFRETVHRPTVLAGPWLVSLGADRAALQRGVAVAREIGKGVFWLGEPDSEVLFRHLRKLGAAMMPDGRILYFRHYDSDVLAAVAPLLDAEQAAYLFGPAHLIGFIGGCGDGATVVKPDDLPKPTTGPITFSDWQIEELNLRQRHIYRQKTEAMLRKSFPAETANFGSHHLIKIIKKYDHDAESIGLTSERSLARWSYLNFYSHRAISSNKEIVRTLRSSRFTSPDEAMEECYPFIERGYAIQRAKLNI